MREKEHQGNAGPGTSRLPQRGKPGPIAQSGAAEEASRTDPRRKQREHQNTCRQRAAGDQEVIAGLEIS
jgi:hypothetical protein